MAAAVTTAPIKASCARCWRPIAEGFWAFLIGTGAGDALLYCGICGREEARDKHVLAEGPLR